MDILAQTPSGEYITIEMQVRNHAAFIEQTLYYLFQKYNDQYQVDGSDKEGPYTSLKSTYGINITDFNLFEPDSDAVRHFVLKDVHNNKRLTAYKKAKGVQATYFSLVNTHTSHPNIIYCQAFFKGEPIPKEAPYYIHDAAAMIRLENLSEEERQIAEAISKSEAIRRAERQYDIEEGRRLEQRRVTISMYQQDLPLVQIASITGLSIGQIKEIIEKQQ